MAREGGYGKSTKAEWLKTTRHHYGEAITGSALMGQTLEQWVAEAIEMHAYLCECMDLQRRFAHDYDTCPSPSMLDRKQYEPRRRKPVVSFTQAGQGSATPGQPVRGARWNT